MARFQCGIDLLEALSLLLRNLKKIYIWKPCFDIRGVEF
jgi:hypothetical protein